MTHDREFDQSDQFLQRRELLTSASMAAAGVLLTGPILGIASAEIALAQSAIAKAAQSKQKVFMVKYAGAFVTALNEAFSYDRLYKSDGTPDRTPDSTIGKFLAKYPTPGSYDESKFGTICERFAQRK
jgi:hypothetical protein